MHHNDHAAALGRVPSGLFILTVGRESHATGMLASWVQQCSFEPPQLTVAVQRGRPVHDMLHDRAPFVINILGEGQPDLLKHFSKGFEPGKPAFEGLEISHTSAGVPILLAALSHLACEVAGRHAVGDHDLIVGRIVGGASHREGRPAVHIRKSGTHY